MSTTTSLPSPLNTPGVYIQEIPVLPASIVSVPTAVPAFVGYTQMATEITTGDLFGVPFMIDNIAEYQQYFGLPWPEPGLVALVDDTVSPPSTVVTLNEITRSPYLMYYSLQMYFANGGAPCYILCIGYYNKANAVINIGDYKGTDGVTFCPQLQKYNDITLIVLPDAMSIAHTATPDVGGSAYYELQSLAVNHCILMG